MRGRNVFTTEKLWDCIYYCGIVGLYLLLWNCGTVFATAELWDCKSS